MLKRLICTVAQDIVLDLFGIYLAVRAVQGYDLMAGCLDSAGLVRFYMRSLGCKHSLMRAEGSGYDGHVGLRAADKKVNVRIWSGALFFYKLTGALAIRVAAVACGLLEIRAHKAVHYLRKCALKVITFKSDHDFLTSTFTLSSEAESLMRATFSPLRSMTFSAIASSTSFCIVLRRLRAP